MRWRDIPAAAFFDGRLFVTSQSDGVASPLPQNVQFLVDVFDQAGALQSRIPH